MKEQQQTPDYMLAVYPPDGYTELTLYVVYSLPVDYQAKPLQHLIEHSGLQRVASTSIDADATLRQCLKAVDIKKNYNCSILVATDLNRADNIWISEFYNNEDIH